ncbi:DUF2127 domain-containing protein [Patescibacteria group bacterium]|nr:DUF2127 domain-containing protein [Patescibacteria group bacterium]
MSLSHSATSNDRGSADDAGRLNHRLFLISVITKGFDSLLEIVGGIAFFFAGPLSKVISYLVDSELVEDPNDLVAHTVRHYLPLVLNQSTFAAFYLLAHGIVKVGLVIALLYRKLWAYPTSLIVLGLFIVYQVYRWTQSHSIYMIALSFFDAVVMILIFKEWRRLKSEARRTEIGNAGAISG